MPGSPYLSHPPNGLLTWPRVLRRIGIPFSILMVVSVLQGVVIEVLVGLTALLFATAIFRK